MAITTLFSWSIATGDDGMVWLLLDAAAMPAIAKPVFVVVAGTDSSATSRMDMHDCDCRMGAKVERKLRRNLAGEWRFGMLLGVQQRKGDCVLASAADGDVGVEADDEAYEEADNEEDETDDEQDASVEVQGESSTAGVPVGGGHVSRIAWLFVQLLLLLALLLWLLSVLRASSNKSSAAFSSAAHNLRLDSPGRLRNSAPSASSTSSASAFMLLLLVVNSTWLDVGVVGVVAAGDMGFSTPLMRRFCSNSSSWPMKLRLGEMMGRAPFTSL